MRGQLIILLAEFGIMVISILFCLIVAVFKNMLDEFKRGVSIFSISYLICGLFAEITLFIAQYYPGCDITLFEFIIYIVIHLALILVTLLNVYI